MPAGRPLGSVELRGRAHRVDRAAAALEAARFGAEIKRARTDASVAASELAAAIGVTTDCVLHWESGRRMPRLEHLVSVAFALRIPLDHLVPR